MAPNRAKSTRNSAWGQDFESKCLVLTHEMTEGDLVAKILNDELVAPDLGSPKELRRALEDHAANETLFIEPLVLRKAKH